MTASEIRSTYWKLRHLQQQRDSLQPPSLAEEIGLAQIELLAEIAIQLGEINAVMARLGVFNIEELALRLEDLFPKKETT